MAEPDKRSVRLEEPLVSSIAQTDALAKLLIEKGLIGREEFMQRISEERATYQNSSIPRSNLGNHQQIVTSFESNEEHAEPERRESKPDPCRESFSHG